MTIVVGYVPTPEGEAALTAAVAEARLREEPLHIVNSARGDALVDSRFVPASGLDDLRSRLDATGVVYEIDQQVRGHEASEEVVDAADRVKASLIVIGLRRRTPTGKLITGSQAQRILLDANCPVLAVKASQP
jgi:nucleotide-binding universal stress UspA family protein